MIMLTKEQLADLLRQVYAKGAHDSNGFWNDQEHFERNFSMAIQPVVNRHSDRYDSHSDYELAMDAGRYRWLRDQGGNQEGRATVCASLSLASREELDQVVFGKRLDNHIDYAIKSGKFCYPVDPLILAIRGQAEEDEGVTE